MEAVRLMAETLSAEQRGAPLARRALLAACEVRSRCQSSLESRGR